MEYNYSIIKFCYKSDMKSYDNYSSLKWVIINYIVCS